MELKLTAEQAVMLLNQIGSKESKNSGGKVDRWEDSASEP